MLPTRAISYRHSLLCCLAETTCTKRMSEPEISTAADRISSLPDDILIHILSSLPTKQAFVTSILSKRWIHLCCCVPNLNLSDINRDAFFSILQSRKAVGNHSISSFILTGGRFCPRLRDLVVGNWETVTPELPTSILACATLVVLKLGWFDMRVNFDLNSIKLPSLKTLHLKYILFKTDVDLALVLEKCPILEDIQLSDIHSLCSYYCRSSENLRQLKKSIYYHVSLLYSDETTFKFGVSMHTTIQGLSHYLEF